MNGIKKNSVSKYNPLSAGVAYTCGNILVKAIPFFTLPIFTRLLGTADFGLYNIFLAYENIISILFGFGLNGTIRVAKVEFGNNFENYVSSVYGFQIVSSLMIDLIVICVFVPIGHIGWINTQILVLLLINSLCTQVYNIASTKYAIKGEVTRNLGVSFLYTLINIGASILLCKYAFIEKGYLGRILGTCIAAILVALIVIWSQFRQSRIVFNIEYWKFGLRMGSPLILHFLSLTLLAQCDKIMIQSMVGDSEAGIYSIAVTLTGIASVLVNSVDNAWAPWFYRKLEDREYNDIYKQNNRMIIIFSLIIIFIMLISPEIIRVIAAAEYWESIDAFPILLTSVLLNFFYLIPVNFEYYHKETKYMAFSTIVTAIINVILNVLFIKTVGFIGAAYATCISKFILLLMHWIKAWELDPKKLMGIKEVISCTLVAISISAIVILLKSMIVVRYSLLFIELLVAITWAYKTGLYKAISRQYKK